MRACLLAAAICVAASSSHAQEIVKPTWLTAPTSKEVMAYYPPGAAKAKVKGSAVLDCKVALSGSLYGCAVVQELPKGYGFGGAAAALSQSFRMTPMMVDGKPTDGGQVTIPVVFDGPKETWKDRMKSSLPRAIGQVVGQGLVR